MKVPREFQERFGKDLGKFQVILRTFWNSVAPTCLTFLMWWARASLYPLSHLLLQNTAGKWTYWSWPNQLKDKEKDKDPLLQLQQPSEQSKTLHWFFPIFQVAVEAPVFSSFGGIHHYSAFGFGRTIYRNWNGVLAKYPNVFCWTLFDNWNRDKVPSSSALAVRFLRQKIEKWLRAA